MFVLKVSGTIVVALLLLTGIFTGALAGGDRIRSNYHTESKSAADERINWVKGFLITTLPILIFIIIVLIIDYFY